LVDLAELDITYPLQVVITPGFPTDESAVAETIFKGVRQRAPSLQK
jgi:hypothetical protein